MIDKDMQIKIPHSHTKEEAITRIKQLVAENQAKIAEKAEEVKAKWRDNVLDFAFSANGTHISGTLTVLDKEFDLYAKLPLSLRLFEGTIERMIKAEIEKMKL